MLQVNNEDVRKKPHSELVRLVGSLKTEVCLKVVHVPKFKILSFEAKKFKSEKKKLEEKNTSLSVAEVGFKIGLLILLLVAEINRDSIF